MVDVERPDEKRCLIQSIRLVTPEKLAVSIGRFLRRGVWDNEV
jgi:hypothetical protein